MDEINWEKYITKRTPREKSSEPLISINRNSGRVSINSAACNLIAGCYNYNYIQLFTGTTNNTIRKVRIQFIDKYEDGCIRLCNKKQSKNPSNGAAFHCKSLVNDIYKSNYQLEKTSRFKAELYPSNEKNILVFDIEKKFSF